MTAFAISGLLALISSLGFGFFVRLKSQDWNIGNAWFIFSLSVAGWGAGGIWIGTATTPQGGLLAAQMAYGLGVIWIAPLFYQFVCAFLQIRKKKSILVHYALSLVFLSFLPTKLMFKRADFLWNSMFFARSGSLHYFFFCWWFGLVVYSHVLLLRAYREVSPAKKNQIAYFFLGTAAGFMGGSMAYLPNFGVDVYPWGNFTVCLYPLIMSYAIVKHRLLDVNFIIRKTLVYSIVTAALTGVYMIQIVLLTHFFERMMKHPQWWGALIAATITTVVFLPLRNRAQLLIDTKFFRSRTDREAQLVEFSDELIHEGTPDQATTSLLRVLSEAFHPKMQALYLRPAGEEVYQRVNPEKEARLSMPLTNPWAAYFAAHPQPALLGQSPEPLAGEISDPWVRAAVPFVARGEVLGFLLLGEKSSEQPYTNEDLILLRIVVNQATSAYERPRLIREVSGGFVHEIKTPLANIALPAELCFLELQEAERGEKDFKDILPKLKRRLKFIMDQAFLASHRVEAVQQLTEEMSIGGAPVVLAEVLRSSAQSLQHVLNELQIRLDIRLPEALPSIRGNARQLEVAFVNLIKNAAEAMRGQERTRQIEVRGAAQNGKLVIFFKDTGPGISAEHRGLVFKTSFTTKGAEGAGMGLHLTRQVVRVHGGHISLEPADGPGACFRIELPLIA